MFARPIFMPRFNSIIFNQNSLKIKFFLQKNAKFLSTGRSAPRPPKQPPIADFWLPAHVIELLSRSKYNTAYDISKLRCAYTNTKIIITLPLN